MTLSKDKLPESSKIRQTRAFLQRTVTRKLLLLLPLLCCTALLKAQENAPVSSPAAQASLTGSASGTVLDATGAVIPGALVEFVSSASPPRSGLRTTTGLSGAFTLQNLAPGAGRVNILAKGFAVLAAPLTISAGQTTELGSLTLTISSASSSVLVTLTSEEIATAQLKTEEQQRFFGLIPNYLVTYLPDAAPLTGKQKFHLASKFTFDPSSFVVAGIIAGVEQADNGFAGYGQGAKGFGKRYGAAFADFSISNLVGSALLPTLFKQDPRYFVKGTGPVRSRLLYAIANSVVRKGDNRHWQPDYSSILGSLAAGGVSNLYYPAASRGAGLIFQNTAIGIAATAAGNILQEFVLRKITTKTPAKGVNHS